MTFRRILVAVDDSVVAAIAFDTGVALARALQAELALVHVVDPAAAAVGVDLPSTLALEPITRVEAERMLAVFAARAALTPAPREFVRVGRPAAEIVAVANEWPADLVVIGSHSKGVIRRALLGSAAAGVVAHARCPVLVVPPSP